jgi:DNA polymerase-1
MGAAAGRPLLAIDGDSLAHRAFHGLPSTIRRTGGRPGNALEGVALMAQRAWKAEKPRAVLVAWDTLDAPTYRNALLPTYQSGRDFDPEIVEQLELLPELCAALGFHVAKGAGYEADDFLAAAATAEEATGGACLVLTSVRDAYQLATPAVTILAPVRGTSELGRLGPAEVVEKYGVRPDQVVDFVALRGDPSDKIPGARGIGEKKGAALLQQHGSLEEIFLAGLLTDQVDDILLYRRIATMDREAPLPALDDAEPTWGRAAELAASWGLDGLARRLLS